MVIHRIYKTQILLSLQLVSFLFGLRTYQHSCIALNCENFELCVLTPVYLTCHKTHDVTVWRHVFRRNDNRRKFCFHFWNRKRVWQIIFPKTYYLYVILHASYFVKYWLRSRVKCHWMLRAKGMEANIGCQCCAVLLYFILLKIYGCIPVIDVFLL
jgi:hypothetical protein